MKTTTTLLCTAALIALAGCAKKPPAKLPPAPPAETTAPTPPAAPSEVGNTTVPGSRADFLQQAGTDTVHFATDSSDLDSEATATLTKQAAWLQKFPNVRVTIEGHCDERGTREYNMALGARRANSARAYLVALGVESSRIQTVSYSAERPAVLGTGEAVWSQNRRDVTVVAQAGS